MSNASPNRCRTCWRKGHTARAHAGLTNAELELVKAEGREFMARGFRELGEQAADGDLFDVLRADTEAAIIAATVATPPILMGDGGDCRCLGSAPSEVHPRGAAQCMYPPDPVEDIRRAVEAIEAAEDRRSAASPEVPKEEDPQVSPLPDEYYGRDPYAEPTEDLYREAVAEHTDVIDQCVYLDPVAGIYRLVGEQGPQFAPWRTLLGPDGPKLITLPGVYDLEAQEYHDPAVTGDWLSNSDARQLIGKGCPAQFRYDKDHGVKEENDAFAMGHAVHARILGKGETIAVRPLVNPADPDQVWDSWRTNASKAWRREQEALGRSVIVPEQAEVVEAMAVAVHSKPDAHRLLSQPGRPEMSLFWVDPETGVRRRTMVDYLPSVVDEYGVMEPVDIKSADEVAPNEDMERKLYNHAWHRQGTTIADGIVALGLAAEVSFHFIVQSKKAPHLVTVVKLDAEAERIGHIENREALHVYKRCLETDEWPDFTPQGPVTMTVPVWVARLYEEDIR